jgi:hypothetical protein
MIKRIIQNKSFTKELQYFEENGVSFQIDKILKKYIGCVVISEQIKNIFNENYITDFKKYLSLHLKFHCIKDS